MMNITEIQAIAKKNLSELIAIRRHLHQNPELSFVEHNTSLFIQKKLEELGIDFQTDWVKTGIVAKISGAQSGPCIALRCELDALPIQEENKTEYNSKNQGVMHACGHDVHMACVLGAAQILNQLKDQIKGTILLVFQPGEEKLPGGASQMIKQGLLKKNKIDHIIALHVFPELEVGKVGFKAGQYMASTDEVYLTIIGKSGHGALPHQNIDPVAIGALCITALQQIVSRNAPPTIPSVLSFGKVMANGATNVIPDTMHIEGTFRTMDEQWRENAHELIEKMTRGICMAHGATCEVTIEKGYPSLFNHLSRTHFNQAVATEYLGEENVVSLDARMTGEDFSFFANETPGTFFRLGIRNTKKGIVHSVHNSQFDVDENAIEIGAGLLAFLAIKNLMDYKGEE